MKPIHYLFTGSDSEPVLDVDGQDANPQRASAELVQR